MAKQSLKELADECTDELSPFVYLPDEKRKKIYDIVHKYLKKARRLR